MKDQMNALGLRYQELLMNQILALLYEKGILTQERLEQMNHEVMEIIKDEMLGALNAARDE